MAVKSIYLAKRAPKLSHDQYVMRWRQHGALAMSKAFFGRNRVYSQSEILHPAPMAGASDEYDGVSYLIMEDKQMTRDDMAELAAMVVDEYETFSGPILPVLLRVEETVLKPGPFGGVTAYLFFEDRAVAKSVGEHFAHADAPGRVVLNVKRDDLTFYDMSTQLPYNAVVEVSAFTLDQLKGVLEAGATASRKADLTAITRECMMWDRMSV